MCAGAIGWSQASALVYGAADEQKGFTKIRGPLLHPKTKITSGIMGNECKDLLVKFFNLRR
jgi:tRNA(adenine34) deaminase